MQQLRAVTFASDREGVFSSLHMTPKDKAAGSGSAAKPAGAGSAAPKK